MAIEPIANNKKARFQYYLLDKFEAGIELRGAEVKSLRDRKVSINESYARIIDDEIFLFDMNISPYEPASRSNHPPKRRRKLLLHKREIRKIAGKASERGLTIIPVSLYFKDGLAKVEIAIAKGKTKYDKRDTIKKREDQRSIRREIRRRR
jgi:SsrA-binding protein